ncbi:hypothetical protein BDK92_6668 [Micromonospora pisi]|uniref:Uncharacterized protein n=1 Tax=Micromonospora pisi TaxID=589240 RepID=A0A495JV99_9ACTN|nr:hypothetical protein [Micromonospora pisi]RKR92232.1 hypothetical protein BDK92_6668 [Micromonospora pisi]
MRTETMLGLLAVEERLVLDSGYRIDAASRSMYQPVSTPLRNDGIFRHWMLRGETYRLEHDGTGWRVHNDLFGHHEYRLVDAQDAQYVAQLPLGAGELHLEAGTRYEIRTIEPMGPWALYSL